MTIMIDTLFTFIASLPTIFLGHHPAHSIAKSITKTWIPGNNHMENLEYVTPSQNMWHFYANRGYQLSRPGMQKPVLGRPRGGSEGEWVWYKSMKDAAEVFGMSSQSISRCTRGLSQHAGGYEFRLAESEPLQLPGEEWRPVDLEGLLRERAIRMKWTRMNRVFWNAVSTVSFRLSFDGYRWKQTEHIQECEDLGSCIRPLQWQWKPLCKLSCYVFFGNWILRCWILYPACKRTQWTHLISSRQLLHLKRIFTPDITTHNSISTNICSYVVISTCPFLQVYP